MKKLLRNKYFRIALISFIILGVISLGLMLRNRATEVGGLSETTQMAENEPGYKTIKLPDANDMATGRILPQMTAFLQIKPIAHG
jgi:hypothetical protein